MINKELVTIGGNKIKFNKFIYALAPMAGVTDFAFRKICTDFGADMVVTEMISLKALYSKNFKTEKMLREEANAIRCCQIFCHEPDIIEPAFKSRLFDHFDIIDLNCGCPAPKIVKNHEGSAMMRNIENSRSIISALVKYSNKPVSIKFRLGIDGIENYIDFAKMCEEEGASFITLHARTREQGYAGEVDRCAYSKLVNSVNIPVFWSGDIKTKDDVDYARRIGCAGVMIGRAAIGNPEIFSRLKSNKKCPIDNPLTKYENHLDNKSNESESLLFDSFNYKGLGCEQGDSITHDDSYYQTFTSNKKIKSTDNLDKNISNPSFAKKESTETTEYPEAETNSKYGDEERNNIPLINSTHHMDKVHLYPYSKKQAIINHLKLLKTYFRSEQTLVAYFKKHLMWYVKSIPNATCTKIKILEFTTLQQIYDFIDLLNN